MAPSCGCNAFRNARLVDERRRQAIGEQIIAGYDRLPESPDELRQAETAARAMIDDEPW